MKSFLVSIAALQFLITLSGCAPGFDIKGYVDPQLKSVSYIDLNTSQKGPSLGVLVNFQTKGERSSSLARKQAREAVLRVLNKAGVFSTVSNGVANTEAQMKILINNAGGETRGSPVATGLTFGAIGTGTIDRYIISASYVHAESQPITKEYQHAIHVTIGLARAPEGLNPMTLDDAFDSVVEQVVLLFLFELQQAGNL